MRNSLKFVFMYFHIILIFLLAFSPLCKTYRSISKSLKKYTIYYLIPLFKLFSEKFTHDFTLFSFIFTQTSLHYSLVLHYLLHNSSLVFSLIKIYQFPNSHILLILDFGCFDYNDNI